MSETHIRISTNTRDTATELAVDGQSARNFIEALVAKYQNGELVDALSGSEKADEADPQKQFQRNMGREIISIKTLLKLIGNHLTGRTEELKTGVKLLTAKIGECVGCGARMKCPDCGCFLEDHFTEPEE